MNFEERKVELKTIALKHKGAGSLAYQLIDDFALDEAIKKITDIKTKTNINSIIKKGYLTGNEQFVNILCEFIYYFEMQFAIVGKYSFIHLANMLEKKEPKFLLCKNYWGNNDFIDYYTFNMKKLFVENFYSNIKFLWRNIEIQSFFRSHKITNLLTLKTSKNIDKLFKILLDFVWCCKGDYCSIFLFSNYNIILEHNKKDYPEKTTEEITTSIYNFYSTQYEILIKNYNDNIQIVRKYLET